MSRALLAGGMLVLAALASACSQTQNQSSFEQGQLPSTRAELYRQYGVPDAIRLEGEDRWLRYDHAASKGMTFGARYWGLGLVIGRSQSQADRLWIRVAPDDRITAFEPMVASDELHYRLWPFGD